MLAARAAGHTEDADCIAEHIRHTVDLLLDRSRALDNGVPSRDDAEQLRRLVEAARAGYVRTVLVPGPWVFNLNTRTADAITQGLTTAGCQVLELPPHWSPPAPTARTPVLHGT